MAKKAEGAAPAVFASPEDIAAAKDALAKAKSKADVAKVWTEFYLKIGHKRLGRLLLGFEPRPFKNE
jgi:tetrahydromethanopterin S-methyltransferase subunit G